MSGGGSGGRGTRTALAGLAAGGVMAGHWIGYAVREPDAGARAVLLESTGHHLLPQLSVLALLAAAVGLLVLPWHARRRSGAASYGSLLRVLLPLQATGFLALETGERVLAHGHLPTLGVLADPAVGIGLVAQVAIACAAAAVVVALVRLVPHLVRATSLPTPAAPAAPRPSPVRRPQRPGVRAHSLRGPPLPSRS